MHEDIKVIETYALTEHRLLCKFSDDAWKIYDITSWLDMPAFRCLVDDEIFKQVEVAYGNPTWQSLNEEITAYDIYVDGTTISDMKIVQELKNLKM